ncbi:MAG: anaerobic ribonucleoside-triphosphate reductase activating protein [Planctomycetota bacterium]|jgi:pyruvate formate lyase activating enzyme|nr:anaerobic ribonucleoside-triphosphate reductase activating protein [Planctomycetota bacterium]
MNAEGIDFDLRGLIENSLLEWDDHVAAVAVAGGCDLRCPYCHSWRYVTGLADLGRLDPDDLLRLLARQRGWIDGVVFTGGEPTLQPGLRDLIAKTRDYGVRTKLHTNGTRPAVVGALLDEKLLDCLALDYKAPLDGRLFAASGGKAVPAAVIRETFALARESGIDREYHTTLAPRFVDRATLGEMAEALEKGGTWFLQQFENGDVLDPALKGTKRYDNDELDALFAVAAAGRGRVVLKRGKSG